MHKWTTPKNIIYLIADDEHMYVNFGVTRDFGKKFDHRKHSYIHRMDIKKESEVKNTGLVSKYSQVGLRMTENNIVNRFMFEMKAIFQSEKAKLVKLSGTNDKQVEWYKIESRELYDRVIPSLHKMCDNFAKGRYY